MYCNPYHWDPQKSNHFGTEATGIPNLGNPDLVILAVSLFCAAMRDYHGMLAEIGLKSVVPLYLQKNVAKPVSLADCCLACAVKRLVARFLKTCLVSS